MAFHEVEFPPEISYGSQGGPAYDTKVLVLDSGAEERVARWEQALHRYDVSFGVKTREQMAQVITFFHARLGATHGFRYKDWADFTTADNHIDTPSDTDQELGVANGVNGTSYDMYKKYSSGGIDRLRRLQKIVANSTVVAYDGTPQVGGWTVDENNGTITLNPSPVNGTVVTFGCEFRVPVRFDITAGNALQVSQDAFDTVSIPSIPLTEIRNENTIQDEFFFGGATEKASSSDIPLSLTMGRLVVVDFTTSGKSVILPDPTDLPPGGPFWFVTNAGAEDCAVKTHDAVTVIAAVAPGEGFEVWLTLDSNGDKVWLCR